MADNGQADVYDTNTASAGECPVAHERAPHPTQGGGNRGWWPDQLNLKLLAKNGAERNPSTRTSTTARRSRPSTCPPSSGTSPRC